MLAFPYLDVVCTLFSHEACEDERQPVCTIVVRDTGTGPRVIVCEPNLSLHDRNIEPIKEFDVSGLISTLTRNDYSYERGWPDAWVEEFGVESTAAMKKVAPWL